MRHVERLRVGPSPIPRKRLTVKRLCQAIDVVMNDSTMRQNAATLGSRLQKENGTSNSVAFITQWMNNQRFHGLWRTSRDAHGEPLAALDRCLRADKWTPLDTHLLFSETYRFVDNLVIARPYLHISLKFRLFGEWQASYKFHWKRQTTTYSVCLLPFEWLLRTECHTRTITAVSIKLAGMFRLSPVWLGAGSKDGRQRLIYRNKCQCRGTFFVSASA